MYITFANTTRHRRHWPCAAAAACVEETKKRGTADDRYNNNNKNQKKTVWDDTRLRIKCVVQRYYNMQSYKNILLF